MAFSLPSLGYDYTALEPHINATTMNIHHTKHHNTYVTNLNAALDKFPELKDLGLVCGCTATAQHRRPRKQWFSGGVCHVAVLQLDLAGWAQRYC